MTAVVPRTVVPRDPGTGLDPSPPAGPGARVAAWVALAAVVLAVVSLAAGDLVGAERSFASLAEGPLEVADGDGWRALAVGDAVPVGRELRTTTGEVALALPDGGSLRLAIGVRAQARGPGELRLARGTVLVRDSATTVSVGATRVAGRGTWRVDAGSRARAATYDGEVVAADGVAERSLPRYAEVGIRDGALAATVLPLRYLAADPIDRRQLPEALRIDELATALDRSLTARHGRAPRGPAFYTSFVTVDRRALDDLRGIAPVVDGDRLGPPADVLLTVVASDALAVEAELPRDRAIDEVVRLRAAGAAWGIVLLRHDLTAAALRAAADRALERAEARPPPAEDAPAAGSTGPEPPGEASPPTTSAPAGGTSPDGSGGDAPSGDGSTSPSGGGGSTGGGDDGGSGPVPPGPGVGGPVEDVVGGLDELLPELAPGSIGRDIASSRAPHEPGVPQGRGPGLLNGG